LLKTVRWSSIQKIRQMCGSWHRRSHKLVISHFIIGRDRTCKHTFDKTKRPIRPQQLAHNLLAVGVFSTVPGTSTVWWT
jgi:hypothetical protein